MSTSSVNLSEMKTKEFWTKPDSLFAWVLLALAVGSGIYFWGLIVPFIVGMLVDTLHMIGLGAILAAVLWLLFSPKSHMLLRIVSRRITNMIIHVMPLDILDDKVAQMKKRLAEMQDQIKQVAGQIRFLKDIIAKNQSTAEQRMKAAAYAKQQATSTDNQNEARRMAFQMKANANKAGRLEKANMSYQDILTKLTSVYEMLTKWEDHIKFYIEDTEDEVNQTKIQYKTVNKAYSAYQCAVKILKGNATEEDVYNTTMQFLAEDVSTKLGAMEDFQRMAQDFMDNIDVQNGAVTSEALKKLEAYEQKILTSGNQDMAFLLPGATSQNVPVPVFANYGAAPQQKNEYDSFFK